MKAKLQLLLQNGNNKQRNDGNKYENNHERKQSNKKDGKLRRHNTMTSQSNYLNLRVQNNNKQEIRSRIKTVISRTDRVSDQEGALCSPLQRKVKQIKARRLHKTERLIDRYDQDEQNLTTQFASEWSRMDQVKRQTYYKLRNKFVKKFPSFRERYQKQQVNQQTPPKNQPQNHHNQLIFQTPQKQKPQPQTDFNQNPNPNSNLNKTSISHRKTKSSVDHYKTACFYSRSAKRCFYNTYSEQMPMQQQHQVPLSKITFMGYMRNGPQKKILRMKKIRGIVNDSKEMILSMEKQGTKAYRSLKKCLEQAMEVYSKMN